MYGFIHLPKERVSLSDYCIQLLNENVQLLNDRRDIFYSSGFNRVKLTDQCKIDKWCQEIFLLFASMENSATACKFATMEGKITVFEWPNTTL